MPNLKQRATRGFAWNAVAQFSRQIVQTGTSIILARLLAPDDFGLVGMAAIFTGLVALINQFGLTSALVQRKKIDREHLHAAFWASIIQGIVLFVIVVLISPHVASYFGQAILKAIVIVSSIQFIIDSFVIVHRAMLTRKLEFKKISIALILGSCGAAAVSAPLAFMGFGVWAIVLGSLGSSVMELIFFNFMYPYFPRFTFKWKRFKELFSFGFQYMLNSISNYFNGNLDYFFIGKVLGADALGYYSLAYRLIMFPQTKLGTLINRVTFPAFSRVQDDNKRLARGYLTAFSSINFVTFPLLVGLAIVAPEFIKVVYGIKWEPAIIPLQLLCFAGLMIQISSNTGSVVLAKGRVDIPLKLSVIRAIILALVLFFFAKNGIVTVAIIIDIFFFVYNIVFIVIANKMIGLSLKRYLGKLIPVIISSLIMAAVVALLRSLFGETFSDVILLIVTIISGIIVYLLSFWYFDKKTILEIWKLLKLIKYRRVTKEA